MGADMMLAFAKGGARDTELITKPYTWAQLVNRLSQVSVGEKDGSYLIRGGKLKAPSRADENLLEAELLIIDGDSRIDPETGGVIKGAPDIEIARKALDRLGYRYILHTTHSHVPGVVNKWRAFLPAHMKSPAELQAAAEYVVDQMHAEGCHVDLVREVSVWAQAWYLPRCKPEYRDAFRCYASLHGRDVDVQAAVAIAAAAKATADVVRKQQELPQQTKALTAESPIEAFNRQADFDSVRVILENAGYRFAGKRGEVFRFIAPGSESGTPGLVVFKGSQRGDWVAYSHHGGHDPLSHRLTDAFGMLTRLRHAGNEVAAIEEAKRVTGWKPGQREDDLDDFDEFETDAEDVAAAGGALRAVWNPWREHAVPPFPMDALPPDVARYVEARATETGACQSAIAMSVLTAASAAITHEARAFLKPNGHWPVSPRLWTAIIGPPSAKKSPAIDGAVSPLIKAQKEVQAIQWRRWKEEQEEDGKKRNSRPELTKYTDNDMTPEGLIDTLAYQSRGLLVVADELSGFLTGFDRYGAGKGAAAGRAIWLQAYNGGYYAATRSSRVVPPVDNLSVSVLGGIQAERLKELGGLTSDGLLQRFLPVWMSKPALDSNSFDSNAWRGWSDRVKELLQIGRFSTELESDAQKERQRGARFLFDLGQIESEGAPWQGFVGKMPGVWGSLALIMHCLWEPQVGTGLKGDNARRASQLVEDFLLPHGLAFYREIAGGSQADNRNIAGFLAGWTEPTIKTRDFVRGPRCCRGVAPEAIVKQLQPFEAGGWLIPVQVGPWNREWKVRPALAEMFAAELERHRTALAVVQDKIRGLADD